MATLGRMTDERPTGRGGDGPSSPGDGVRGGSARRARRTRRATSRRPSRPSSSGGWSRRGCRSSRRPRSCRRRGYPSWATPPSCSPTSGLRASAATDRCWSPTRGAGSRARGGRPGGGGVRQRDRDVRAQQPRARRGRVDRDVPARSWPGPGRRGSGCGATCRCASATRGRATSRWTRSSTSRYA